MKLNSFLFLLCLLVISTPAGAMNPNFTGSDVDGDGYTDQNDVDEDGDGLIEIWTVEMLNFVRIDLAGTSFNNSTVGCPAFVGCHGYELMADLDLDTNANGIADLGDTFWNTGAGWVPMGQSTDLLRCLFEGNGHTINNLFINGNVGTPNFHVGLFTAIAAGGVIRNLGLGGVFGEVTGPGRVGPFAGQNDGTLQRVWSTVNVTNGTFSGGIVSDGNGTISDAWSDGAVTGDYAGGIIGVNNGTVERTLALGNVTGRTAGGALVGQNNAITRDSFWDLRHSNTGVGSGVVSVFAVSALDIHCPQSPTDENCSSLAFRNWPAATWNFGSPTEPPGLVFSTSVKRATTSYNPADYDKDGVANNVDVDKDGDGLIEVSSPAMLTNIANNLVGSSYNNGVTADSNGCGNGTTRTTCSGYELTADIDLGAQSWTPLGSSAQPLNTVIEGNGFRILNLVVNAADNAGFAAYSSSIIRNVAFAGTNASITGANKVGVVAGTNTGTVLNVYSSVSVNGSGNSIGGLIGENQYGVINRVSSVATVTGNADTGGVVGYMLGGTMTEALSRAVVTGTSNVGALVGRNNTGTVTALPNSYWNTTATASGIGSNTHANNGTGIIDQAMRCPQAPADTRCTPSAFSSWSVFDWDFGSRSQYPELRLRSASYLDLDRNGLPDSIDADDDGDGLADDADAAPKFPYSWFADPDNDAFPSDCDASCGALGYATDIDDDGDGLIDIGTLATLNQIRHNLAGTGLHDGSVNITSGCGNGSTITSCNGYELVNDLNFDSNGDNSFTAADTLFNSGNGWVPVGSDANRFATMLEGNGFRILNYRSTGALFRYIGSTGIVRNLGFDGPLALVAASGTDYAIAVAYWNYGAIDRVYVDIALQGHEAAPITGINAGTISNTLSLGSVTACRAGGMTVTHVGQAINNLSLTALSATCASPSGLAIRLNSGFTLDATNVWNTNITTLAVEQIQGTGTVTATGVAFSHLSCPTSPTDSNCPSTIYSNWDTSVWNFGTHIEAPALILAGKPHRDFDGDLVVNADDPDDDNDGTPDTSDACPHDASASSGNTDGDQYCNVSDVDDDGDGLIDIRTIGELDAIRNNTAGTALNTGGGNDSRGCASSPAIRQCNGYELLADINFDTNGNKVIDAGDSYFNGGAGWDPINGFSGTLEGNGHRILNLYISRIAEDQVGFFRTTNTGSTIRNIGLTGPLSYVRGSNSVGAFAGVSNSNMSKVYSSVHVHSVSNPGGLAADIGTAGAVTITDAISAGLVQSDQHNNSIGGFAAVASKVTMSRSLFIGTLSFPSATAVGAIAGLVQDGSQINHSVVWNRSSFSAGLGFNSFSNFWAGGFTASEIRCITAPADPTCTPALFGDYSPADWHFGNNQQMPRLVFAGIAHRDTDQDLVFDQNDPDDDNDGFLDGVDPYPFASIVGHPDFDMDGRPDTCNAACLALLMTADPDDDNDGTADVSDDCPNDATGFSGNNDGDQLCDATDVDDDNDGVNDPADAYPFISLGGRADFDADGRPDNCDATCTATGMAADPDDDNDGAPDTIETNTGIWVSSADRGTNPFNADTDGDGINDGAETNTGIVVSVSNTGTSPLVRDDADSDNVHDVPDVDEDGDGLIDIRTPQDLNNIRYNLAGTGYQTSSTAADATGCGNGTTINACNGYELLADIVMNVVPNGFGTPGQFHVHNVFYNGGLGFEPIGSVTQPFTSILEGNGFRIINLYINRPGMNNVALFGKLQNGSTVRNLGMTGWLSTINGNQFVGSLAAVAEGNLQNVYSRVPVSGDFFVGGIAGSLNGSISNLRYDGSVGKPTAVVVGGIAGVATTNTALTAVLSNASVTGALETGALFGRFTGPGAINNTVYWNTDLTVASVGVTTGVVTNAATGSSLATLRCPAYQGDPMLCATGIYAGWDANRWHMGTSTQLPALILAGLIHRDENDDLTFDDGINDTDADGVIDALDDLPNNPSETRDRDRDGIGDNADIDDDNDFLPHALETALGGNFNPHLGPAGKDSDGNGRPDLRQDFDGDGISAFAETLLGLGYNPASASSMPPWAFEHQQGKDTANADVKWLFVNKPRTTAQSAISTQLQSDAAAQAADSPTKQYWYPYGQVSVTYTGVSAGETIDVDFYVDFLSSRGAITGMALLNGSGSETYPTTTITTVTGASDKYKLSFSVTEGSAQDTNASPTAVTWTGAAYINASMSISPGIVSLAAAGSSATLTLENKSDLVINLGSPDHTLLNGVGSTGVNCNLTTISKGQQCTMTVQRSILGTNNRAVLSVVTDHPHQTTQPLTALLTSSESKGQEARRRLPPTSQSVTWKNSANNVVNTLTPGETYTLSLGVLGYNDEYSVGVYIFNCATDGSNIINDSTCAPNTGFALAGPLSDADGATVSTGTFSYGSMNSRLYTYEIAYTVSAAWNTAEDLVLRAFYASPDDVATGGSGTSLLIPGGRGANTTVGEQGRKYRIDVSL